MVGLRGKFLLSAGCGFVGCRFSFAAAIFEAVLRWLLFVSEFVPRGGLGCDGVLGELVFLPKRGGCCLVGCGKSWDVCQIAGCRSACRLRRAGFWLLLIGCWFVFGEEQGGAEDEEFRAK